MVQLAVASGVFEDLFHFFSDLLHFLSILSLFLLAFRKLLFGVFTLKFFGRVILIKPFIFVEVVELFPSSVLEFADDTVETFFDDLSVLVASEDIDRYGFGKNSTTPRFVILGVGRKNEGLWLNSVGLG